MYYSFTWSQARTCRFASLQIKLLLILVSGKSIHSGGRYSLKASTLNFTNH